MSAPHAWYAEAAGEHARAADTLEARASRLGTPRVASFLAAVGLVVLTDPLSGVAAGAAWAGALLAAVGFVAAVVAQRRLRAAGRARRVREALAREGLARLARDWDALARAPEATAAPHAPPDHPYATDLGVFGHASLERLCGPVTTAAGRDALAEWLLAPAAADVVRARQGAVGALAPAAAGRLELAARGRGGEPEAPAAVARFLGWAEAPGWLTERRFLGAAAWLLPPVTVVLLALYLAGVLGAVAWPLASAPLWFVPLALQSWALWRVASPIAADMDAAVAVRPSVPRYAAQLEAAGAFARGHRTAAEGGTASPLLDDVLARVGADGEGRAEAPRLLRSLARWLDVVESRANAYYPVFNYLLLADVHLHRRLEAWKAAHGRRVRGWLEALGEVEALAALATLAHDHPDWAFPEVGTAEGAPFRARALGHPLLPPDRCVRNDVALPPPGEFLLVTGSNMSGKSTLLRALGANAVLALAGGPVCADALALEPVRVFTSMTVDDSLESGVSRFMAELLRMKRVVEAAWATRPSDPPVLYLLDEVLQGTNTAERRAGARTVLRHLLDAGAVGAATTHDLTLHTAPDLERRTRTYHFQESVERGPGGPRLAFDYRLRPGPSTTTNALVLLEAVGLGPREGQPVEEGEEAAREEPAG